MRLLSIGIFTTLFLCGSALRPTELYDIWGSWKTTHGKTYTPWDESLRFQTWLENVVKIQSHNLRYQLGMETYSLRVNEYTDLSWTEFASTYLCLAIPYQSVQTTAGQEKIKTQTFWRGTKQKAPDAIDWRTEGLVRRVKNQGQCGSCWAFATTGVVEGQYSRKYGSKTGFSEQQLVDCSRRYGNEGCNGGLMTSSYRYLMNNSLESEGDYPYEAMDNRCRANRTKGIVKVKSYTVLKNESETALKELVGTRGPVAVGIHADDGFQFYSHGIYVSSTCSSWPPNHGVLVVGYGAEANSPFWIVKNSWGINWGEDGYIRMARNRRNMCHIASMASVPEVIKT